MKRHQHRHKARRVRRRVAAMMRAQAHVSAHLRAVLQPFIGRQASPELVAEVKAAIMGALHPAPIWPEVVRLEPGRMVFNVPAHIAERLTQARAPILPADQAPPPRPD